MKRVLADRPRPVLLLLAAAGLAALTVLIVLLLSRGGMSQGEALARYGYAARQKHAVKADEAGSRHGGESQSGEDEGDKDSGEETRKATPRVKGGKGGEGSRHGAKTPWGEQVANRAYPRGYVDDRLARKEAKAFGAIPATAPRNSFRSTSSYRSALAAAPEQWTNVGPTTPNVAGEASQFYDPTTGTGPATQESGRISAVASDPTCVPGNCRVWLATAGGGVWRTADALAAHPTWTPPPDDVPTNAFGSLLYDAASDTLYAGSGEPNGSSDSEAGLGLFQSTDGGATWTQVPGSAAVATNRAIGGIAVDDATNSIYIGTAVARHGSSSTTSGRRTPPNAPALGVYKSTDGGAFVRETDLSTKTPQDPTPPSTGTDFFAGGIDRLQLDPNHPNTVYAGVFGYGMWRSTDGGTTWEQVFHTVNQTDFANQTGDSLGDITTFDLVDLGNGKTRAYLGDASDDFVLDGDPSTPEPEIYRSDDVAALPGSPDGSDDSNSGWVELSNPTNGTSGYPAYGWCQNGQCSYDAFIKSPAGHPNEVWAGGSMNYDELPAYAGQPPRSNGRAVIRSTNANGTNTTTTWQDMTVKLADNSAWNPASGLHPDEHGIAFSQDGANAFEVSDGGIYRIDVSSTDDRQSSCDQRQYVYDTDPQPLLGPDLADCHELLNGTPHAVTPLNDGLADLQFQSLAINPKNPEGELLGGTQDNGTWSFTGTPAWFESVGGDGGQSGFNSGDPVIRFHNYYDATPDVNFHANDPQHWLAIYDPLQESTENRGFYTPFVSDPKTPGRLFTGLESVWRTDDNGGDETLLEAGGCNEAHMDYARAPICGDWVPIGSNLTGRAFGADRRGQYVVETQRAESDTGTLWAATRTGRVFVTSNADMVEPQAVQFTRIDDDATTPGRFPSGISVDPADPDHAFVSYSGYEAYTPGQPGHVFEVTYNPTTRKSTWVDRSYNIKSTANPTGADQPVTGVQYDGGTGDLYASTDFGVLRLPKGSTSWEQAAANMPTVAVAGLSISQTGRVLYAATHGRSAYVLRLSGTFTPPGSGSGGTPTPTPSPTATPTPTVTPTPGKKDHTRPKLILHRIHRVNTPHRSTLHGKASDASGLKGNHVRIRWGDAKITFVKVHKNGTFTAHHRYKQPKAYQVRVTAVDNAGNSRLKKALARVLRKHETVRIK